MLTGILAMLMAIAFVFVVTSLISYIFYPKTPAQKAREKKDAEYFKIINNEYIYINIGQTKKNALIERLGPPNKVEIIGNLERLSWWSFKKYAIKLTTPNNSETTFEARTISVVINHNVVVSFN
jgi:hypothetical protein